MTKFVLTIIRQYLNILAHISPKKAGGTAANIFRTPRKGRISPQNKVFLDTAIPKTLKFEDFDIQTYQWQGTGETVVLLHGWESNAARWQKFVEKLQEKNYNIIAFDAPAHGASGSKLFDVVLFSNMLDIVVEHFKPETLIGHSAGAMAVAYYLQKAPPSVLSIQKAVLLAAPARLEAVFDNFQAALGFSDKVRAAFTAYFEEKLQGKIAEFSLIEYAKKMNTDCLIIHDKNDRICPFEEAQEIHKNWKNALFIATKGYGHRLDSDKVQKMVVDWLTKG